jgi:hypothetical protein
MKINKINNDNLICAQVINAVEILEYIYNVFLKIINYYLL